MAVEFSEYRAPRTVGLFSEPLPEHDGLCWPVCGVDGVGMPHGTGATPKRAFLAWGEHGAAPADAVWVKVTDLGGLTDGGGQEAFLWACLHDCRLFLHLGAEAPAPPAVPGVVPESGSGFAGKVDDVGMLEGDGVGRHGGPAAYVAGLDERDGFLKSTDAGGVTRWRADASWDILATLHYTTANPPDLADKPARVLTLWMVCSGNVICFYTTAAAWAGYTARNWAAFGSLVCQYGYDPKDEGDGVVSGGWQDVLGGVAPVIYGAYSELCGFTAVAPLPWQGGGGLAVFPDDAAAVEQNCGTLNVTHVEGDTGLAFGNASFQPDPGLFVCPRLHFVNGLSAWSGGALFSAAQVATVLYGEPGDFLNIGGHYALAGRAGAGVPWEVVPGFNLLFDPWAVEGLGLHRRGTPDFARVDARDYLPPAPGAEWVRVAAATLRGPVGPVYLDIAGADVDGCLLTASGCTEYMG